MAQGPHALSTVGRVPLLCFEVPNALWLANRAFLPVVDHLNQENSYAWSLYISNLAMPVITSDVDVKPQMSETGFIQLPIGSTYAWTEPEGRSFGHSATRVRELREEIYRMMYLAYQGRSSNATADGASGASKEMDMMPAQDIMNEYGDIVIAAMQLILDTVAQARDEQITSDVRGMKFGKTSTLSDLQRTEAALALAVPSRTFEKEVYRAAAREYLPDANPEVQKSIIDEIEAAPTNEEKQLEQAQQRQQQYRSSIEQAADRFSQAPPITVPPKTGKES